MRVLLSEAEVALDRRTAVGTVDPLVGGAPFELARRGRLTQCLAGTKQCFDVDAVAGGFLGSVAHGGLLQGLDSLAGVRGPDARGTKRAEDRRPSVHARNRDRLRTAARTARTAVRRTRADRCPEGGERWGAKDQHQAVSSLTSHALFLRAPSAEYRLRLTHRSGIGTALGGCRGFKGPVPPPLWMSAS